MDKNDENVLQDVQTIRNILFGEQLQELIVRIEKLEGQAKNLKRENRELAKLLDQKQQELDEWKSENASSYSKDQKSLASKLAALSDELHKRIESERLKQSELIEMLAGALTTHLDKK